jgi:hypothetical protein
MTLSVNDIQHNVFSVNLKARPGPNIITLFTSIILHTKLECVSLATLTQVSLMIVTKAVAYPREGQLKGASLG